jgi:hypothetical protein
MHYVLALAVGFGCQRTSGAVGPDLEAYLDQSVAWAPLEADTARTIERILRTEFVDEAEVRHQITDSRPRLLAHLERLRGYRPQAEPVARLHRRYIAAWERLLGGYEDIEKGFSTGDYSQLAHGREAMAAWRDALVDVAAELRELRQRFIPGSGPVTQS